MDIASLLDIYFPMAKTQVTIDVFDEKNIYSVYERVIGVLTQCLNIEISVLQAINYCFYEVLDNVLTHSGKQMGIVVTYNNIAEHKLSFLVADDGIGIQKSLSENAKYQNISEEEALQACIKESVTDGKGMGFGLYSTSLLVHNAGRRFEIHSGQHCLLLQDQRMIVKQADTWQGTIVYMELITDEEINPQDVVANRTNVVQQFNDAFLNDNEIETLW